MIIDYRCSFSGVSLIGAETMVVLTACGDAPAPVSLPLWGSYEGSGVVVNIDEGPNAERILSAWDRDLEASCAFVDWAALDIEPLQIDHIETLIALVMANEYHGLSAVTWQGAGLSLCLLESNVAACIMQDEPAQLHDVRVEDLTAEVLGRHPIAHSIYSQLPYESPKSRCKFGLGALALSSLTQNMALNNKPWARPQGGITEEERDPARWLAEAYLAFADEPALVEALEEYTNQQGAAADEEIEMEEDA